MEEETQVTNEKKKIYCVVVGLSCSLLGKLLCMASEVVKIDYLAYLINKALCLSALVYCHFPTCYCPFLWPKTYFAKI